MKVKRIYRNNDVIVHSCIINYVWIRGAIHSLPSFQAASRNIFLEISNKCLNNFFFKRLFFLIFHQFLFYYVVKVTLRKIGITVKEIYALSKPENVKRVRKRL